MELKEFIEKFTKTLEVEDAIALTGSTNFRELDEWSSLSTMLLAAFYVKEFGKEVSVNDIKACHTISDLYKLSMI
ncbi:MAG: phosphopantetheine-binding protein [Prevotella sp.]|nr:phosphopantetheine-binding protein [Prevotella sp.]